LRVFASLTALAFASAAASADAAVVRVTASGIAFVPATITAHVGDTVEWTNKDFVAHTATARSGEWDVALPVNGKGSVTLKKPGELSYYCRVHPNMVGKIKVTAK
jgi:plastocyanin